MSVFIHIISSDYPILKKWLSVDNQCRIMVNFCWLFLNNVRGCYSIECGEEFGQFHENSLMGWLVFHGCFFLFLKKLLFIYLFLAASGLICVIFIEACGIFHCGAWASLVVVCGFSLLSLWCVGYRVRGFCSLRHVSSLVEARELTSCGVRA